MNRQDISQIISHFLFPISRWKYQYAVILHESNSKKNELVSGRSGEIEWDKIDKSQTTIFTLERNGKI